MNDAIHSRKAHALSDGSLDSLLDLEGTEKGYGSALYAAWDISLCCSLSCTCTSC